MNNKILLVDGHNLLFRMFFGLPNKIPGKEGKSIHGIVGFIGTLIRTINLIRPTHLLIIFDSESGSFRDKMIIDYKGNRLRDWSKKPAKENPFSQLSGIKKTLDHLDWKYCEIDDVEADDIIASYVKEHQIDTEIIILSHDTDLLQLVGQKTKVFYQRGKMSVLFDSNKVKEKYGVEPKLLPDLKALTGDKTDNIAGVPKVGIKTAQKLIQQFGNIDKIFEQPSKIYPQNLQSKIIEYKDKIYQNLSLIKLDHKFDLPFKLSSIIIKPNSLNKKTIQLLKEIKLI